MTIVLLSVLGLLFGSFVNALVWRLRERKNWVSERSECPHCHHKLAPIDLVPVLSWLALGGKCRYCRKRIPDSPLVELAVPASFVLSYLFWPEPMHGAGLFMFICWLVFLVGFVALAVYDFKWFLLPNAIVFPLMGLAAVLVAGRLALGGGVEQALGSLAGVAVIWGLFHFIFWISKGEWIGFGDVKLAVILGVLAGGVLPALTLLFIASFIGVMASLPMVLSGKAGRKSHVPFGPMLIAATFIVVLFGEDMVRWYASLLIGS